MIKLYISIIFLLQVFLSQAQTTVTLTPAADNSIYQDFPGNSNGIGINIFAGNNGFNSPRRALLRFDFSSIPSNVTITNVSLSLNCNFTTQLLGLGMSLFKLNQSWGEGSSNAGATRDGQGTLATINDATWNCAFSNGAGSCSSGWTSAGGTFNASSSASTTVGPAGTYVWAGSQLATDVQSWLFTPASNFGWILLGDETQIGSAKRFGSRENSNAANRPTLSVTYNNTVPVTLSFFKAQETKYGNRLYWQTAQESNNAGFKIEHSADETTFKNIGYVNGAGNSSVVHNYSFLDEESFAGKNFYRLAQTDFNGHVSYGEIIVITNSKYPTALNISPNPVTDMINLKTSNYYGFQYRIMSATGMLLQSGQVNANKILLVAVLSPGSYFLQLFKKDGTTISGSFIKQ
ncbi:MAG: DNRLRE domain-containing protein [Ferruginibacter sp.]